MMFEVDAFSGIMPALMTPYHPNGAVNVDMIRRLTAALLEDGANGFFVCGDAGEGLLLTPEERMIVARTVIEFVAGQVPVIVHVGACSTEESALLASHAKAAGADAVGTIPPIYYRVGFAGTLQHVRTVAEAADLPTFYCHDPALMDAGLSPEDLSDSFLSIPGLVGLTYSDTDMFYLWSILDSAGGRLRVFNGLDRMLFHGLCAGARGGIGSTCNYQMRVMAGIYRAVSNGDFETALALQRRADLAVKILSRNGGTLACEKAIMRLCGFDVGAPRGPMPPFPEHCLDELRRQLDEIGFFEN
jgi:dihydrodipicolinate synthase/N-acetylneuraminate lyase